MSNSPGYHRITLAATAVVLAVQLWALIVGISPNVSRRAVQIAEGVWPGYAAELRQDPAPPDCDRKSLDERVAQCAAAPSAAPTPPADPFADPPAPKPPADPFAEAPAADPFASGGGGAAPVNCEALRALRDQCVVRHEAYDSATARITPALRSYRRTELVISEFANFHYWKELLSLVLLLGGLATTVQRNQIAIREPRQRAEHRMSQGAQLAAHLSLFASAMADWQVQHESAAEAENGALPIIWAVGFLILGAVNVWHMVRPPHFESVPTNPGRLALVVPLYAYLAVFSELYFVFIERHYSGAAIYLHKFVETPSVYIGVALYVWAGMLLSETRIASTAIDVLIPWKLPVWLLAWIVVAGAALPTAYSGASGIFVLAAGSVIFQRLRAAGADHRLALAATAMCGSLGVVLRPCLVVVLITLLNKQVTTSDLYGWGFYVYLLTASLFGVAMIWRRPQRFAIAPASEAGPPSLDALRRLAPYLLIGAGVLLFYAVPLDTQVNENTAAVILPVLMLLLVIFDKRTAPAGERAVWVPLRRATAEGATQVGALLLFMATSVSFGGVIERTEIIDQAPQHFGSVWAAMAFLVVAKVFVGMLTDVLGGVVLVSVTLAPIAYRNGINPVHFWMMVMCAFELAYLLPPVALNQLLARQVIGKESHIEEMNIQGSFFERHEHVLLPITVMGTALVLVAFVPLFFYAPT